MSNLKRITRRQIWKNSPFSHKVTFFLHKNHQSFTKLLFSVFNTVTQCPFDFIKLFNSGVFLNSLAKSTQILAILVDHLNFNFRDEETNLEKTRNRFSSRGIFQWWGIQKIPHADIPGPRAEWFLVMYRINWICFNFGCPFLPFKLTNWAKKDANHPWQNPKHRWFRRRWDFFFSQKS